MVVSGLTVPRGCVLGITSRITVKAILNPDLLGFLRKFQQLLLIALPRRASPVFFTPPTEVGFVGRGWQHKDMNVPCVAH
jgi:hypothetical protein